MFFRLEEDNLGNYAISFQEPKDNMFKLFFSTES